MRRSHFLGAGAAAAAAICLLWKTQEVAAGVRAGLENCAGVLIPSLFPFMILAGLITSTGAGSARAAAVPDTPNRLVTALCLICMCAILLPDGPRKRIRMTE